MNTNAMLRFCLIALATAGLLVGCASQAQRTAGLADIRSNLPCTIRAVGYGYEPTFKNGSRVRIDPVPYSALKRGDYVVFWPSFSTTPVLAQLGHYQPFEGWETLVQAHAFQVFLTEENYLGRASASN